MGVCIYLSNYLSCVCIHVCAYVYVCVHVLAEFPDIT